MSATKKRNCLPLKKRVELIKHSEKHPEAGVRELGALFECGRTQVGQILKNKEELLSMYESSASGSRIRSSAFAEVNKALYEWYLIACSKNVCPGGSQLIEKGKEIAQRLGKANFTGSRGWLEKWRKRYNVALKLKVCGESGAVSGVTVESWKERLPEILRDYSEENIWTVDESGVFWQALPDNGFGQCARQCHEGKKSKRRMTVAFFVSAAGKKEFKPVVIWKSEKKELNKSDLPVNYFSQKKAWMTGEIMDAVLTKLNRQLSSTDRHILLFMDNVGCHPEPLATKYSNVKICFLPASNNSKLQPLGLGIIQNFKVNYRRLFLRYVLSKIDESRSATDVAKSITILVAVRWVATAWSKVSEETISKCFRKAGILTGSSEVVSHQVVGGVDPSFEAGARSEVRSLIERTMPAGEGCSVEEYIRGDNDLPVCMDLTGERWDANFLSQLGQQEESEEEDDEAPPPPLKVQTFKEAIDSLESVQRFLESQGHIEEALLIGSSVDEVALQSISQTINCNNSS